MLDHATYTSAPQPVRAALAERSTCIGSAPSASVADDRAGIGHAQGRGPRACMFSVDATSATQGRNRFGAARASPRSR
jgi:hypothetical protein